jgi:hypothetical protein
MALLCQKCLTRVKFFCLQVEVMVIHIQVSEYKVSFYSQLEMPREDSFTNGLQMANSLLIPTEKEV